VAFCQRLSSRQRTNEPGIQHGSLHRQPRSRRQQTDVSRGGPARRRQMGARNSLSLGVTLSGLRRNAATTAPAQSSARELSGCRHGTKASVFPQICFLLRFCSQEEHKNQFLPSSPRRLTSSCDNSFRCFSASSLCREKKPNKPKHLVTSGLSRAPSDHQLTCVLQESKRQESQKPRDESLRVTVLLLPNTQMFFCC